MTCTITAVAMRTCLGDLDETVAALERGAIGVAELPGLDHEKLGVRWGYPIADAPGPGRVTRWLREVVGDAVAADAVDPTTERVAIVLGTGLRQFADVERWWLGEPDGDAAGSDLTRAVRDVLPGVDEVLTIVNACAASGYALALGEDLLAADEHDAVIVVGCDGFTESMLTMIGRVAQHPTPAVRPFDADRQGVLLGEGAAAAVLRPDPCPDRPALARLRGVGLSCDAYHPTAPDINGIVRCMRDAHQRAGVNSEDIDLVVAHGTGTALNDPVEATALARLLGPGCAPPTTALKGAIGHTSGAAGLMSLICAVEALGRRTAPAIAGLRTAIDEARGLRLLREPVGLPAGGIAQIDAFGFGGVNAAMVVEVA